MKSFLQTQEWLKFQESAGHKTWYFPSASSEQVDDGLPAQAGKIKANIIRYGLPFGKSYLYIPHGPEIDFNHIKGGIKNELANFVKYLRDLAKEEKAIFVKIEPVSDIVVELLYRRGFRKSFKQVQPYKTVVLDLNLPEEELLTRMHQKTRYNINLSAKKELKLEESDDVEVFWKLLKKTAEKDNFFTHTKEYYQRMLESFKDGKELKTKLFFVSLEGKPIGASLVMIYGENVYYLHGAMDRDYKSLMAPYFMHWEIIKWAKAAGYHYYDFWGINANKWPGVTRFKLGWGGDIKEYPGSFDLAISRPWYLAYSFTRKFF